MNCVTKWSSRSCASFVLVSYIPDCSRQEIIGKNESLPRFVKNVVFLWKNFGILVEYRFSRESITLQRISNVWNYSSFGKFQEFSWNLTLEYLWNFYENM